MNTNRDIELILSKWRNEDWTELEELEAAAYVSDAPIFAIGGCARSGTTLLRVMLDSHSDIACGPHSNLFVPVALDLADLSFKFDLPIEELIAIKEASKDRAEFIDRFRLLYLKSTDKKIWGEKTARNVHRFGWIIRHFRKAKVIHVIRDGRDVVCSLRTHRKRRVVEGTLEPTGYIIPLEEGCARWLRAVRAGLSLRDSDQYLQVRYEDLVLRTEDTLKRVCSNLALNFEPRMIDYHTFIGPSRDPLKFPQNVEATTPLYKSAIGRWEKDLSKEELRMVMEAIGPLLGDLGYAV